MTFELLLAEGKVKPQQITALHLLSAFALLGTGSVFYFFYSPMKWWGEGLLAGGILLLLVALFRNKWLLQPQVNRVFRILELMIALCLTSYMAMERLWAPTAMFGILSVVLLLAFFWEKGSGDQFIYVTEDGIRLPFSSRKRLIEWREVDSIIHKFGTLTINCEGNKLYQWNIKKARFDNTAFESFCNQQTEAHRSKRVAEW